MLANSVTVRRPPTAALSALHLAVFLSLALGALIWGTSFLLGGEGTQLQRYLGLLGFYAVSSAAFVVSRIRRDKLQLFEIPVFITVTCFVQFGLIPLRNFIDATQIDPNLSANGEELVQALAYVTLGMMAFWAGCGLIPEKRGDWISPGPSANTVVTKPRRGGILLAFGTLYAVGFITKVYLLDNHLFAYTTSMDKYYENLASMQVLHYVSQFGALALIVATIERYRNRRDPLWRVLFMTVLISEVLWGLISGMKGLVLQNFLVVALVSSFVLRKLNLRWFGILFFGLVLLYPISNAYRSALNRGDVDVTSLGGAAEAGQMALGTVGEGGSTGGDFWRDGVEHALQRLDLLTSVAAVLSLGPRADMVRGDVPWWTLPFYPFVPRFLWPSKAVLDEGGRFTVALTGGHGDAATIGSSTAITYPGDLYLQFGLLGIPLGMFVLGVVSQWFTNRVSRSVEPWDLFLYGAVFLFGFPYEVGAFDLWATLLKILAIVYVVRWAVYGHRRRISGVAVAPPVHHRRPAASFPALELRP
jgi:hypothetical protein